MEERILHVDDMVCYRCILAVKHVFEDAGWKVIEIDLGVVRALPPEGDASLSAIEFALEGIGLQLREDGYKLVAQIKGLIIQYVYNDNATMDVPLSEIITQKVDLSYSYISRYFSRSEQRTIEEFYQLHRIERSKRLLFQTEKSIKKIARRLKYRSAGHFSTSFRKLTGETPSDFRSKGSYTPIPIDKL